MPKTQTQFQIDYDAGDIHAKAFQRYTETRDDLESLSDDELQERIDGLEGILDAWDDHAYYDHDSGLFEEAEELREAARDERDAREDAETE